MLNTSPVATIFRGVLLLPCPLYSPLYVLLLNVKNSPGVIRRMYMTANSDILSSRWNNPTSMGAATKIKQAYPKAMIDDNMADWLAYAGLFSRHVRRGIARS